MPSNGCLARTQWLVVAAGRRRWGLSGGLGPAGFFGLARAALRAGARRRLRPELSADPRLPWLAARLPPPPSALAAAPCRRPGGGAGECHRRSGPAVVGDPGPNTGGKTVSLKSVRRWPALMARARSCSFPAPVRHGCRPLVLLVLADIGDEQSLQQNLSTFQWEPCAPHRPHPGRPARAPALPPPARQGAQPGAARMRWAQAPIPGEGPRRLANRHCCRHLPIGPG